MDLKKIRERLTEEKNWLEQSLWQNSNPLAAGVDFERGQGRSQQEVNLINHETTRKKLGEVERALDRLDAGKYGLCVDCGKPINPDRLAAYPHVETCRDCHFLHSKSRSRSVW